MALGESINNLKILIIFYLIPLSLSNMNYLKIENTISVASFPNEGDLLSDKNLMLFNNSTRI